MKSFYQVVAGQIVSLFGNAALRFALPLYLLRQTGSAALYGAVTALAMLPSLAGMLVGGVLADRCRKARLMAVLDLVTAGLTAAAAALLGVAPLVPLTITALGALYAIQGLYQPAVRASLPLLLEPEQLLRGNAVIQTVDTVDELLGPLLGSVLMERMSLRGLLLVCAGCFAASAWLEWCIRIPQDVPSAVENLPSGGAKQLWAGGWSVLRGRPKLIRLAAWMAAANLLEIPAITVGIPVIVVQTLGGSDAELGVIQAVLSAGGLAGGALAALLEKRLRSWQGVGALYGIAFLCVSMGGVLLLPGVGAAGIAVLGFAVMAVATLFNVWFFARLQTIVPAGSVGQVTGLVTVLACLTQPVGQAVYGLLFECCTQAPAWVLAGAGAVSAVVLRLLDKSS